MLNLAEYHATEPTISSLEIARITGKPHRNVTADIARILAEAEIDAQGFLHIYRDAMNRDQRCYHLPRRECDLVISGYSVKYRLAIIDRWQELEAKQAFQIPSTMAEALRLAADQAEQLAIQSEQLQLAAPKVEFFDQVMESDTVCSWAVAAQTAKLPFGQNTLLKKLREAGILISGGQRHNLPLQRYIEQGLFTVNEYAYEDSQGERQVRFTSRVTQKGIAWLIKRFGTDESPSAAAR